MDIIDRLMRARLPFRFDDGRREELLEDLLDQERRDHQITTATLIKLEQQKKEGTYMTHITPNNTIDVPVDLGMGYVVTIKGLPGRPSVAACERLCKVIMAYAVEQPLPEAPKKAVEGADADLEYVMSPEFLQAK